MLRRAATLDGRRGEAMSDEGSNKVDKRWFSEGLLPREGQQVDEPPALAESDPEHFERLEASIALYRREASASVDPRRRAELCFEIGRIHERELDDDKEAIAHYQRAVSADPTHVPSLRAGRRVFGRAGRWAMVLKLIDAEIRVRRGPRSRARLLCEKGEIYLARFDRPEAARVCFSQALDFAPDDAAAVRGLTTAAALAGDGQAFAEAAERAASTAEGDAVGRAMAVEAAAAWAELGHIDRASELLRGVLDAAPGDGVAAARLADVRRQAGDVEGWIDAQSRLAERIVDPQLRAARRAGLARAASANHLPGRAAELWTAALADDPARTEDRRRLADLLERDEQPARAAEVWSRVADELVDVPSRLEALWRLAGLCEGPLAAPADAIAALARMLDIEPAHGPAVRRILRLSGRSDADRRRIAEILGHCAETADDPVRAAAMGVALGEVRAELDDRTGAVAAYRAALERDPRSLPAARALADAEAGLGDWRGHRQTLEHILTLFRETEARTAVLARIADVAERRLADEEAALDAWMRLKGLAPDDARARSAIERLSATTDLPPASPPASAPAPALGPADRVSLWTRGARMAWLHTGDTARATRYVQRAIQADPQAAEPRALLEMLRGDQHVGARLDRAEARLELASSLDERRPLLLVLGELRERDGDDAGALAAYELLLELEPGHPVALREAERLAGLTGALEREAELLVAQTELAEDIVERTGALVRLGALYGGPLDQRETAADAWSRAIETAGDAPDAVWALLDAYEADGDAETLAALHGRLAARAADPAEALVHWQSAAQLYGHRLDEGDRALEALESARAAAPDRIEPLLALERIRLSRRAFGELVALYDELAGLATTAAMRAEFRLSQARIAESVLDDLRLAFEAFEDVLLEIPDHPEALEWMEGWADEAGDLRLLAEILERRLQRAAEPRERRMILLRAGRVLRAARQYAEAAQCYEAVLQIEPRSPIALRALREVYEDLGEREKAIRITEVQGRVALDPQNASELLVEAGRSREIDQRAGADALDDYLAAVERNPHDDEAAAAVRRICEQVGRWREMAEAWEVRAQALPERRRALLEEAIALYTDRLGSPRDALRVLKALIPGVEADEVPPLLQRLADLYVELEDWPAAAATYRRLRTISPDRRMRRAVSFRLAAIHGEKLADVAVARGWLQSVLDDDPQDVDALERLADLELAHAERDRARIALARGVNAAEPGRRRAGLRQRIARMDLEEQHIEAAIAGLEAAVEDVPDDPRLLEALADACLDAGRPSRARVALQQALAAADPRSEMVVRLRQRVAEAALAEGTDPAELIETLRSAVGKRPDDGPLRTLFAEALGRRDEHVAEAIDQLRWLLARAPLDAAHLRALRRQLVRAGRHDDAGEIARLRVAAGVADEDDTGLLGGPGDAVRPMAVPLPDEVRQRLWGEVDPDFVAHLRTLAHAVPAIFGPRPPSRPVEPAQRVEAHRLGRHLGIDLVLEGAPLPFDVFQRADGALVASARLSDLPPPERAFFVAMGLDLARDGVDVVSRWAPDALRRRVMAIAACAGHPLKSELDGRLKAQAARLRPRYGPALRRPRVAAAIDGLVGMLSATTSQARAVLSASQRVALLAAGGVGPASRALARTVERSETPPALAELARFATSSTYADLRARLGRPPSDDATD